MTADDRTDGVPATSPELEEYRLTARAWLAANLPLVDDPIQDDDPSAERLAELKRVQALLHQAGYSAFTAPATYGGQGLTSEHERIFAEEGAPYDVPLRFFTVSINILGAALAECATHEQKQRYLPKIFSGEEVWLGFLSEPSGGSDLAGLLTSAVRDGDHYVVNGQKIWSSGAHVSDFALCPVRTRWDVPKHQGISVLIIDLHAPGIEIRQIRQINGEAEFCEEFFTDVEVPTSHLIGVEDDGWQVTRTMLEIEHAWIGKGGTNRIERADAQHDLADLVALAREAGVNTDPGVRRRLAALHAEVEVQKQLTARVTHAIDAGLLPGGYGSLLKLGNDTTLQHRAEVALDLSGAPGVAWPSGSTSRWADDYLHSRSSSIAGGTDEIQRNNISERLLGLPREASPDRGVPFNQVPHN